MIRPTIIPPQPSYDAASVNFPTHYSYTANVPPMAVGPMMGQVVEDPVDAARQRGRTLAIFALLLVIGVPLAYFAVREGGR